MRKQKGKREHIMTRWLYQARLRLAKAFKPFSARSHTRPKVVQPVNTDPTGPRLAWLLTLTFVGLVIALTYQAITAGEDSPRILAIARDVLPFLLALLAPIIHHYFTRKRNGDEDDEQR